jgi:hypothetical protein
MPDVVRLRQNCVLLEPRVELREQLVLYPIRRLDLFEQALDAWLSIPLRLSFRISRFGLAHDWCAVGELGHRGANPIGAKMLNEQLHTLLQKRDFF